MKRFLKQIYQAVAGVVIFLTTTFLLSGAGVSVASASDNFSTDSHITYTVGQDGVTTVAHQFKITNLTPTTYLSQHTLKLSYPTLSNIRATTNGAVIRPEITKEGSSTSVMLNFDDDVVGEGQVREFTVTYDTPDVAQRLGAVLEVRVPVLAGSNTFASHLVTISVPSLFGEPVRYSPKPDRVTHNFADTVFTYTSNSSDSISLQFGSEQHFRIVTTFPFTNESASPAYGQIALPPDTSFQRFEYRKLEPKPTAMKIDADGNWIATYLVPPNQEMIVTLEADVTLSLEPDMTVRVPEPTKEHTASKPHWQLSDSVFDTTFGSQTMKEVYQTVIDTLTYDTERVEAGELSDRMGATAALENPTAAVCQEYADVLVAAWRRAGVPARRLNGYAHTTNQATRPLSFGGTVLHAWVEYFDTDAGLWRMVDPTWEDTTGGVDYFSQFDLNHIVFSIYGTSSTEPYPAGSYADAQNQTNLIVSLTDAFPPSSPDIEATFIPVTIGSLEIPGQHQLTLTNKTGRAWYDITATLKAENADISPFQDLFTLLPFEEKTITVYAFSPLQSGIIHSEVELTLTPKGEEPQTTHVTISAAPAIVKQLNSLNATTPVGGAALICFLAAGSLLVFRRKRKSALRWQGKKSQETPEQLPPTEPPKQPN